jgi:tetratricopeptide (TPR) repeat protein
MSNIEKLKEKLDERKAAYTKADDLREKALKQYDKALKAYEKACMNSLSKDARDWGDPVEIFLTKMRENDDVNEFSSYEAYKKIADLLLEMGLNSGGYNSETLQKCISVSVGNSYSKPNDVVAKSIEHALPMIKPMKSGHRFIAASNQDLSEHGCYEIFEKDGVFTLAKCVYGTTYEIDKFWNIKDLLDYLVVADVYDHHGKKEWKR